jgi:hypothetical protein
MPSLATLLRGGATWAGTLTETTALTATGAGATQTTATAITTDQTLFTTVALNTGALLPTATNVGETYWVCNAGANALALYPPVGHKANAASANTAVSIPVGKAAYAVYSGASQWLVVVSA